MNLNNFFKKRQLFLIGILIIVTVASLDLYSKKAIFSFIDKFTAQDGTYSQQIEVLSFFSLVKVLNAGVSFGMFNKLENSQIIFSFLQSFIAVILMTWLYFKLSEDNFVVTKQKIYFTISICLVAGGAFGNAIDRMLNGAVADFLDFHIAHYHWPAFNLADSCVFIGVFMLIFEDLFFKKPNSKK